MRIDTLHLTGVRHQDAPRRPPVTDIMTWLQCYTRLAVVLSTRYPNKVQELWAYQSLIIRAARNYEGQAWVAYDRQYQREALASESRPELVNARLQAVQ